MASSMILEQDVEIPFARSLEEFRAWARSDAFPDRGRIDHVAGHIEVDMSPENLHFHGKVKTEINRVLAQLVKDADAGELYTDRARVSCPRADLSAEPDVLFLSNDALDSGRARLVPVLSGEEDNFIEIEGAADLVVEIVSTSSGANDTQRLPRAYWRAGIREFWLVDARGDEVVFSIQRHGAKGYEATQPDADGFQHSAVFDKRFRLTRRRNRHGRWDYDLEVR
jgi:Uma2 family endonuclease